MFVDAAVGGQKSMKHEIDLWLEKNERKERKILIESNQFQIENFIAIKDLMCDKKHFPEEKFNR